MWVILISKDLQEWRESALSEIFENNIDKKEERYLSRTNSKFNKYNYTVFLPNAITYKTKSGAERMVADIKKSDNSSWRSKYHNLYEKHLSVRKITVEEWNKIINHELSKLDKSYNFKKSEINKKRLKYFNTI